MLSLPRRSLEGRRRMRKPTLGHDPAAAASGDGCCKSSLAQACAPSTGLVTGLVCALLTSSCHVANARAAAAACPATAFATMRLASHNILRSNYAVYVRHLPALVCVHLQRPSASLQRHLALVRRPHLALPRHLALQVDRADGLEVGHLCSRHASVVAGIMLACQHTDAQMRHP